MEVEEFINQPENNWALAGRPLRLKRGFTLLEISFRLFGRIVRIVVKIILSLIVIVGILSLLNHLWLIQQSGQSFFSDKAWQGKYIDYFWLGVMAAMYWFFLHGLAKSERVKVLDQKHLNKKSLFIKSTKPIELTAGLTGQGRQLVDSAHLRCYQQHRQLSRLYLFDKLIGHKKLTSVFARLGLSIKKIREQNFHLIEKSPKLENSQLYSTLALAYFYAFQDRRQAVELVDLLQAVIQLDNGLQDILLDNGVSLEQVINVIKWIKVNKILWQRYQTFKREATYKPKGVMDRAMTAIATPVLDNFSQDLTALAKSGYLPLCLARDAEIQEIFNIIEGGRNSVILVGQSGVGKSNIISGIANLMVAEEVPKNLQDKRLVSISIPELVAGASQPGIIENRLMAMMNEIIRAGNVILHLDNIHDLAGIGEQTVGNLELAEVFAKFLSHKSIITLATSNPTDYSRYLLNTPLGNLLQKVQIEEPDDNRAILMVEGELAYLEGKQHVYFLYEALEKAVKLSRRFIPDHYLPEKAMRVLEETAMAAGGGKGGFKMVSAEDVAKIISAKTKIPLTQVSVDESKKLLNLEELIHQRMVNQEEAVNFVSSALRRARAELRDQTKPIVNLLFLGPTGVGKTELAKTVAQIYFGSEDNMIRLDMSEYQLPESLDRLIGSRSMSKSGQLTVAGGVLTEAVKAKPFALLLLDEIEKAHPDILNLFLQVMDDGRLTDALGKTYDFSNVIIIATSNAGTQFIQDSLKAGLPLTEIKNQLLQVKLKENFKPEFLNRFDGVVVFKPLTNEHLKQIATLMLDKVKKRLKDKGIYMEVDPPAIAELAQIGFDPVFGARPLRRTIQERVDNALANYLLTGKISRRDKVILAAGGQIKVEKAVKY